MDKKKKVIIISIMCIAIICIALGIFLSNKKQYTITFDTNGGNLISNQEVKEGSYASKPNNPIKIGYKFLYWTYNGNIFDFTTKIDKNITLVAKWESEKTTYQVSLEVDGKKQTLDVTDGELIDLTKLTFEEKEGKEIKWKLNDKEFDIETEKITENISLIGEYVDVKTYTVSFNSDGGSKVDSQKVNENRLAKVPTEPTKEGYVFDAWYLDNKEYDFKEKVTKNITLKAKWIEDKNLKRYTVKFDSNGGSSVANQTIIENKKATKPNNPTRNGFTFVEWQLNGKAYDFNSKVTSDITLKAVWNQIVKYTVAFNSDGGSSVASQSIESGNKATKPNDPTKSGYEFGGWTLNGKAFDFNTAITGNITLKASWTQHITYTVSFNTNGGTSYPSQTIESGGKATNPGNPTRSGYIFTGWSFDFNTVITKNTTVYANWREPYKFVVKFDSDGGSSITDQVVLEGGKASRPSDPTKTGATFTGWTLNGNPFDFSKTITENITLKANWNQVSYKIVAEPVDSYSTDLKLKVMNGQTVVTNYRCISLTESTEYCIEGNVMSKSSYARESTFYVIFNDGSKVTATK